jgi:hypothetical protein
MGAAAIGAHAQTQPAQGRYGHAATQEQRQARMAEFMAKREAKLHDELKLTSAQEPAWQAFTSAIKPQAQADRPDRASWASLPAPERMQKMITLSKEHTARMEQHLQALNTFYSTLSPEQKKIFDQHTLHAMGGKRWGHGGQHGHGMRQQGTQQG